MDKELTYLDALLSTHRPLTKHQILRRLYNARSECCDELEVISSKKIIDKTDYAFYRGEINALEIAIDLVLALPD